MLLRLLARECLKYHSNCSTCSRISYSTFKSTLSLDKLYPNSSLDVAKAQPIPQNEPTKFSGFIPMEKVKITSSKSSGPGGQNVNNVNSKVDIRFKIADADWIPEEIRNTLRVKYRTHVSKEGYFLIQSDRTRSQHLNLADAFEKLRECIRACEPQEPVQLSEDTLEKLRKAKEKAVRERLRQKKERHLVKSDRGSASFSATD